MGQPLTDNDTIKLWQGEILATEADYPHYWRILALSEQQHASSIVNGQLHKRYVEIHARLRILLAQTLNTNPKKLRIHKAEHGKPYLVDYPELKFNLSHTDNRMVVVIAKNCELGVDIEQCTPRKNLAAMVDKCFAEEEKNYWLRLPTSQQTLAFYQFWTRKEAFVKATGRGIALGLKYCVINPDNQRELARIPEKYGLASDWLIQDFDLGEAICGALVAQNKMGNHYTEIEANSLPCVRSIVI